jgi:hypothetical protein
MPLTSRESKRARAASTRMNNANPGIEGRVALFHQPGQAPAEVGYQGVPTRAVKGPTEGDPRGGEFAAGIGERDVAVASLPLHGGVQAVERRSPPRVGPHHRERLEPAQNVVFLMFHRPGSQPQRGEALQKRLEGDLRLQPG